MHRSRRHIALLVGLLLLCALAGCQWSTAGFLHSINPLVWLGIAGADADQPARDIHAHIDAADPTGLIRLFGHLSTICIIFSVLGLLLGLFTRAFPITLPILGILVGIGLALARAVIEQHPGLVYACYGIALAIVLGPHLIAAYRAHVATVTGKPVAGRTGIETLRAIVAHVTPKEPVDAQGSDLRRPVRPAGVPVPAPGSIRSGGDGSDGSGTLGI